MTETQMMGGETVSKAENKGLLRKRVGEKKKQDVLFLWRKKRKVPLK